MKNFSRLLSLVATVLVLISLSACTTTRSTFDTPYSASTAKDLSNDYDRQKAAETRLNLGLRYLAQGDNVKAKFNLDKALKHMPVDSDVLRGHAWYYEKVSEKALAEKYYQMALKADKNNPELLNQYGVFLCRNNQLEKSFKLFTASAKILSNKDVAGTYENAATCSLIAGDTKNADKMFRRALNHNPKQRDSLIGMAEIEYGKARYNRARSYLTRYERIAKHSARSLWLGLRTASMINNRNDAASYALKLVQLYPDSDQTADYLDTRSQWLR